MKKVYLVYMEGITECGNYIQQVWAVFSNKRKAEIYCRYKEKTTDNEWKTLHEMKTVKWKVETEIIREGDYTLALKEIQEKELQL